MSSSPRYSARPPTTRYRALGSAVLDELLRAVADEAALGDGLTVPLAGLTANSADRADVHQWLSDIRVFDGARALTVADLATAVITNAAADSPSPSRP
ncbi:hypothetical protein [Kitasatospora fiedleri]|uniref:hypothetical protein n=1 Tax=Kitasatospora fiedleri TaxID=2991545 RepID=UPI00249AAC9A|nr:hypothetical protein [Kitasatospora fiedleri]